MIEILLHCWYCMRMEYAEKTPEELPRVFHIGCVMCGRNLLVEKPKQSGKRYIYWNLPGPPTCLPSQSTYLWVEIAEKI